MFKNPNIQVVICLICAMCFGIISYIQLTGGKYPWLGAIFAVAGFLQIIIALLIVRKMK